MSKRIKHFDCLSSEEINDFLSNPSSYKCVEKIDGYSLVIGRDADGQYIRQVHSAEKHRSAEDIAKDRIPNTYRRAVCKFIESNQVLDHDEEARVEILFGPTPNVVTYSSIREDEIAIVDLSNKLSACDATISLEVPDLEHPGKYKDAVHSVSIKHLPVTSTLVDIGASLDKIRQHESYVTFLPGISINGTIYTLDAASKLSLNRLPRHPEIKTAVEHARNEVARIREKSYHLLTEVMGRYKSSLGADFVEGWVFSSDRLTFKVVDRNLFLRKKTLVWEATNAIQNLPPKEKKQFLTHYVNPAAETNLAPIIDRRVKEAWWELAHIA